MNTNNIFTTILDYAEDKGIDLTQAQMDIIQRYASKMAEELEAETRLMRWCPTRHPNQSKSAHK
jgi:hypothetical protein